MPVNILLGEGGLFLIMSLGMTGAMWVTLSRKDWTYPPTYGQWDAWLYLLLAAVFLGLIGFFVSQLVRLARPAALWIDQRGWAVSRGEPTKYKSWPTDGRVLLQLFPGGPVHRLRLLHETRPTTYHGDVQLFFPEQVKQLASIRTRLTPSLARAAIHADVFLCTVGATADYQWPQPGEPPLCVACAYDLARVLEDTQRRRCPECGWQPTEREYVLFGKSARGWFGSPNKVEDAEGRDRVSAATREVVSAYAGIALIATYFVSQAFGVFADLSAYVLLAIVGGTLAVVGGQTLIRWANDDKDARTPADGGVPLGGLTLLRPMPAGLIQQSGVHPKLLPMPWDTLQVKVTALPGLVRVRGRRKLLKMVTETPIHFHLPTRHPKFMARQLRESFRQLQAGQSKGNA